MSSSPNWSATIPSHTPSIVESLRRILVKRTELIVRLCLFLIPFLAYASIVPIHNIGDGFSVWIVAQKSIEGGGFNFWGQYNILYDSPFFSYTYNDIVIKGLGEIYPLQFTGTMLIYIIAAQIGGQSLFYLISPAFGALCLLGIYLISREMTSNVLKALFPSIVLGVSPLFVLWSIFPGNTTLSTAFFIYMLLYLIRMSKKTTFINTSAFGACLIFMVLTRYPNVLLAAGPMLFLLGSSISKRIRSLTNISKKSSLLVLLIVPVTLLALLLLLDFVWFNDPFFIAYLAKNNVPYFSEGLPAGSDTYLGGFLSVEALGNIVNYTLLFFVQSNFILPLFIVSWVGIGFVLKYRRNETNRVWFLLSLIFLISTASLLAFYGASSSVFWSGPALISLPHFRYLFALYSLLPLFFIPAMDAAYPYLIPLKPVLKRGVRIFQEDHKLLTIAAVSVILILPSLFCFNYGEVSWVQDVDSYMTAYHVNGSLPSSGSVIMYADRWPLLLLLPEDSNYAWFYYLGIPAAHRYNETYSILERLLDNNETVLFFSSKYDINEVSEMLVWLRAMYVVNRLNETYIERFDAVFYRVSR
jgi:hypothetical protein